MGYGPIDSRTARHLAATTPTWERVLTDPTGSILHVDRYRPTEHMRRMLVARDEHCRFPGCTTPANRCDLNAGNAGSTGSTAVMPYWEYL